MPTFEFLKIVKESAYGTVMSNPIAGTDSIFIRLTEGNSFSVQPMPQFVDIMYGGGEAIVSEIITDYFVCSGRLQTVLYPTQASLLMHWLTDRINTGQTSPWVTTEPPGDLASVSIYHAYQLSDGTLKRSRYPGVKPSAFTLSASRTDPVWKLSIDLQAQKVIGNSYDASSDPDATEFPAPLDADLPTGPYTFNHSAGGLLLGSSAGTVRTQYENLNIQCTNSLDARSFESRFLQVCAFRGRRLNLSFEERLKASPDDRSAFEAATKQRAQLTISNGTHSVVMDFKSFNTFRQLTRNLPIDKIFTFQAQIGSARDPSATTDFSVTVT